jgi:hypothetical protein
MRSRRCRRRRRYGRASSSAVVSTFCYRRPYMIIRSQCNIPVLLVEAKRKATAGLSRQDLPISFPLRLTPWIPEFQQPEITFLICSKHRVRVTTNKSSRRHSSRATPKQILLIHLTQLFLPESVFVHDVLRVDHGSHATSQVFNPFTSRTAFDRAVIAVSFGVCFLNQWQPSLVGFAVGEVQGFAAALESVLEFVCVVM